MRKVSGDIGDELEVRAAISVLIKGVLHWNLEN
jgi:hypothetical protein